jgi:hypothetical protein
MTGVPESPLSVRPVRGTAGLRGFIMKSQSVMLMMGCGGTVRNVQSHLLVLHPPSRCILQRFVCPTPKEGQGEQG